MLFITTSFGACIILKMFYNYIHFIIVIYFIYKILKTFYNKSTHLLMIDEPLIINAYKRYVMMKTLFGEKYTEKKWIIRWLVHGLAIYLNNISRWVFFTMTWFAQSSRNLFRSINYTFFVTRSFLYTRCAKCISYLLSSFTLCAERKMRLKYKFYQNIYYYGSM